MLKVIVFVRQGCAYCNEYIPILEDIGNNNDDIYIEVMSTEIPEIYEQAQELGIPAYPATMIVLNNESKENFLGFASKKELLERLEKYR